MTKSNTGNVSYTRGRFTITQPLKSAIETLIKRADKSDRTLNEYYRYFKLQNQNTANVRKKLDTLSKKLDQVLKALQRNA